jgi:hypothetical protein
MGTIEEAAEKEYPKKGEDSTYCDLGLIQQDAFINGAKWQSERMYSEEEVIELLNKREDCINQTSSILDYTSIKEWFKQFKK